ncbi:MAG: hypothetical protein M1839_004138 [Geoglossum umbratile]|nr:MAG: hypothetical protein M1839_004138 [Geoglossum umbratile]
MNGVVAPDGSPGETHPTSSGTSVWLDRPVIPPYSLDPQAPGSPYRINNTTAFPPKTILRTIFGSKKKPRVGVSPDCRFAFFNTEKQVLVFSLSEEDNSLGNENENAPCYEWRGRAVAVAMGKRYIAMVTSENKLVVENYCNNNERARWAPQLEEIAKGSVPRLAICDDARTITVAAATIAAPVRAGQGSANGDYGSRQQRPQEKKDKGALLIYRFPAPPGKSNPRQQPRPTLARESLDVAPDFVSLDSSGQWLVCITKVSTVHMVRVWSISERVQLWCSELRSVGDEVGVSGLTSSLLFSFPSHRNSHGLAPRTYALTTSGRSSTKHYPEESAFLLRIPENEQPSEQTDRGQNPDTPVVPKPRNTPPLQVRNFQLPAHIPFSSAAIPPQANVVAFLDRGGPKAEVYLLPLRESRGSLVGGRVGEVKKFKTGLGGEVAMGFTSRGDKLLVVNHEGLVWRLGFADEDTTESSPPIEL